MRKGRRPPTEVERAPGDPWRLRGFADMIENFPHGVRANSMPTGSATQRGGAVVPVGNISGYNLATSHMLLARFWCPCNIPLRKSNQL